MRYIVPALLALVTAGGCETSTGAMLDLDAEGVFRSSVFLDRNGDRVVSAGVDGPVEGAQVALVRMQGDTVARGTTDAAGAVRIPDVPVGRYRVVVHGSVLGDTLQVVSTDSAEVSVAADDSTRAVVTLGYAQGTIAGIRALPQDRIVAVEGVALHASNLFGDSTMHIFDPTGALRLTRAIRGGVVAGDSARFTGRTRLLNGVVVLDDPTVVVLGKTTVPDPQALTTGQAATAEAGRLDAALVRIANAEILDASQVGRDIRLKVDDGSGPFEVVADGDARITSDAPLLPGATVTATGVLVPTEGAGVWELKLRSSADLVVEVEEVTIAAARRTAPGRLVAVRGVALNGWAAFGDATVHVSDASGAIRAVGVSSQFVAAGDSVRMVARVAIQEGQPVLIQPTVTILGKGTLPPPVRVDAAEAASARAGSLDAALVQVTGVRVDSTAAFGQDVLLQVTDASGVLVVFLDANADTWAATPTRGTTLDVTGVLIPSGDPRNRAWVLKPRSNADLVRR